MCRAIVSGIVAWDAGQLLVNIFFFMCLVTVPQFSVKVNSAEFPSSF